MSTEIEHNPFNDSIGLVLECKNQEEIDLYWDYFTELGKEVECGWCIDKYGLRWQILPENLEELMSKPNGYATLMNQKKIIIAEY
jgi:predicted 3-demethylubiquinone-9 3-methyltransferase (glyoxalase superfamily)